MIYDITQNQGITKITDTQTNTLTYTTNGIQSSRGESLTFERDNQGRITKITDLAGKEVTYNYNASNDLSSVTDQIGYTTSYTFMESAQAGVATMAQEVSYLLIAKYAVMQNEINFITGKTR
jgi:YD repeat-containing protein